MHDLLEMSLKDDNLRLNNLIFKQLLSKYLNSPALAEFENYIINGQLIDFTGKLPEGLSLDIQNNIPLFQIESEIDTIQLENFLKL